MKHIFIEQKKILKKIKYFFSQEIKTNKTISLNEYYYLCSWADTYGNWCLKNLVNKDKNFFINFFYYIKYTIEYSLKDISKFENLGKISYKKYKNLIITYSNSKNLKKKNLYDNIFSTNINNSKKTLWIIINVDKDKISRLHKNVIIIQKKKNLFFLKPKFYFLLIRNLFLIIFFRKKLKENIFINHIRSTLNDILKSNKIINTYLAYESQPHQHAIIQALKENNQKINIIGYLHSCLTPLPTDFFYKKYYEPDKLIVCGATQKNILSNYLGWPKNKIDVSNSFRYIKKNKSSFSNKIYLSYSIGNPFKTFKKIEYLVNEILKINFTFNVINHPFMEKSSSHKKLSELLKKFNKKTNNLNRDKIVTIVVGVSAIILEILENGKDVFHICNDSLFEAHSNKIWDKINVTELGVGFYHYSLKQKGSIIKFGSKNQFKKKFDI